MITFMPAEVGHTYRTPPSILVSHLSKATPQLRARITGIIEHLMRLLQSHLNLASVVEG